MLLNLKVTVGFLYIIQIIIENKNSWEDNHSSLMCSITLCNGVISCLGKLCHNELVCLLGFIALYKNKKNQGTMFWKPHMIIPGTKNMGINILRVECLFVLKVDLLFKINVHIQNYIESGKIFCWSLKKSNLIYAFQKIERLQIELCNFILCLAGVWLPVLLSGTTN